MKITDKDNIINFFVAANRYASFTAIWKVSNKCQNKEHDAILMFYLQSASDEGFIFQLDLVTSCIFDPLWRVFLLACTFGVIHRVSNSWDRLVYQWNQTVDWYHMWWMDCLGRSSSDAPRIFYKHLPCIHPHFQNLNMFWFPICYLVELKALYVPSLQFGLFWRFYLSL